jgi:hypothetical protein
MPHSAHGRIGRRGAAFNLTGRPAQLASGWGPGRGEAPGRQVVDQDQPGCLELHVLVYPSGFDLSSSTLRTSPVGWPTGARSAARGGAGSPRTGRPCRFWPTCAAVTPSPSSRPGSALGSPRLPLRHRSGRDPGRPRPGSAGPAHQRGVRQLLGVSKMHALPDANGLPEPRQLVPDSAELRERSYRLQPGE